MMTSFSIVQNRLLKVQILTSAIKKREHHIHLPLPEITVKDVKVIYPEKLETKFTFDSSSLTIDFTEDIQARFFEIAL